MASHSTKFSAAISRATRSASKASSIPPLSSSDLSSPPASDEESSSYFKKPNTATTKKNPTLKSKRTKGELSPQASATEVKAEPPVSPALRKIKPEPIDEPPPALGDLPDIKPFLPPLKKENGRKVKKELSTVPPENWEEMYALVKKMRIERPAPVDTMGCDVAADQTMSPLIQRFHILISLMLSSQTKDTTNAAAMSRLRKEIPGGLTLQTILDIDPPRLNELIGAVGFHRRKTEYIKKTAVILRDQFNGDIPDSIEGLTSLPGVGPKMAHLAMSAAWDKTMGIGVDVHVHRITNLWGWVDSNTPEETRHQLEAWLPKDKWREINWLLVGFGQVTCLPRGRKCGDCYLSSKGLCRAAFMGDGPGKRKKKAKVESDEDEEIPVKREKVKEDPDADFQAEVNSDTARSPAKRLRRRIAVKKEVKSETESDMEDMEDFGRS
ncbi:DNA glycosylase [Pyronema omphalodes]|nr:DNA glycosylase [Pyronema omphalodes]